MVASCWIWIQWKNVSCSHTIYSAWWVGPKITCAQLLLQAVQFCCACFFFFSFFGSALGLIHLFLKKDGWCPDTFSIDVLCTSWGCNGHVTRLPLRPQHLHRLRGPKVCMGSTKMCLGITTHILDRQKGSQGKKEASNAFVLHAITTRLCVNIYIYNVGGWPVRVPRLGNHFPPTLYGGYKVSHLAPAMPNKLLIT
jgi:hypothetical protein